MSYSGLGAFVDAACSSTAQTGSAPPGVFFERRCLNLQEPAAMAELKRLMVDRLRRPMVDSRLWTPADEAVLLDWASGRQEWVQRTGSGWAYPTEAALVELLGHCFVFVEDVAWHGTLAYRNVCDGAYPILEPLVHFALSEKPRQERVELVAPPLGVPSVVRWLEPGASLQLPDDPLPPEPVDEDAPPPVDENPPEVLEAGGMGLGVVLTAAGLALGALAVFRGRW